MTDRVGTYTLEGTAPPTAAFSLWVKSSADTQPIEHSLPSGRGGKAFVAGSGPAADLKLTHTVHGEHEVISGLHFKIFVEAGRVWIEDHSKNGTRLGNRKLEPKRRERLVVGDEVHIPGHVLWLAQLGSLQPSAAEVDAVVSRRVFADPASRSLVQELARVARSRASVLLLGEAGVGKEVCAEMIHALSLRQSGPFVPVNCAAIPEGLAEAELFGSEKGAHSTAKEARIGLVAQADGGTLFLDEIGALPLALQPKLLRFLEDGRFRRLGAKDASEERTDVRLVAATNEDLVLLQKQGRFSDALLSRLGTSIRVPALRERRADIVPLAKHFLKRYSHGRLRLGPAAEELLVDHDWPGNVRQLSKAIETAVARSGGEEIVPADLRLEWPTRPAADDVADGSEEARLRELLATMTQKKAAEVLGVDPSTISRRAGKRGLRKER